MSSELGNAGSPLLALEVLCHALDEGLRHIVGALVHLSPVWRALLLPGYLPSVDEANRSIRTMSAADGTTRPVM